MGTPSSAKSESAKPTKSTLLLLGSETAPFLREATETLNDALPSSRIVIMEGQVHAAMNTAPELFVDEVLAFLLELQQRWRSY